MTARTVLQREPGSRATGVSLHSHTLHSREGMLFIPRIAARLPWLRAAIDTAARRRGCAGIDAVCWDRLYWTPPVAPLQAYRLESAQIRSLGMRPLVSITDHDDIDAPLLLSALPGLVGTIPISVEWTLPFRGTFFHVGAHNLPAAGLRDRWQRMASAAAAGAEAPLISLLADLRAQPGTLVVLNHPFWDEKGIGAEGHRKSLWALLEAGRGSFDALEWNGFRPPAENGLTMDLAGRLGLPVVAGGDRHGLEPNSCLNVTDAPDFTAFAAEVRHERRSEVLLLPHHFHRHTMRVIHHLWEILREDPDHGLGWRHWDERVFYRDRFGVTRSLREHWGDRPPRLAAAFVGLVHLLRHEPVRQAVRAAVSFGWTGRP